MISLLLCCLFLAVGLLHKLRISHLILSRNNLEVKQESKADQQQQNFEETTVQIVATRHSLGVGDGPASFKECLLRLWKRRHAGVAIFSFDGDGQGLHEPAVRIRKKNFKAV